MAAAASNIVLVGDQMQLPQPVQGVHPGETGLSSLEYLLEDKATVPEIAAFFLNETRRLHLTLYAFISEAIYDGRLSFRLLTTVARSRAAQRQKPLLGLLPELQIQGIVRDAVELSLKLEDVLIVAAYICK
jgi:uncharacterized protein